MLTPGYRNDPEPGCRPTTMGVIAVVAIIVIVALAYLR